MSSANDVLLASRAALLGDRSAFGQLVERHQAAIRRFLLNLTGGNEELSKDLAQEIFVKAWLNIASFRAAAKFSTWLFRIAYNTFYDYTRSSYARQTKVSIDLHENIAAEQNVSHEVDFASAMKVLRPVERTAMLLFYMESMPIKKVADVMSCSQGAVKSYLFRGREKLAKVLKK
jgi:RNA polymerase sigma-70 factor (ECF subfamily)